MNKAYLLILCLLSASFTGCIEEELESATEEETSQEEENNDSLTGNEIVFFVQLNSKNEYTINVVKVKDQVNLTDLNFFLKDESGSTYVGGNGFGSIGMMMWPPGTEDSSGIDMFYDGDNENLKARAEEIKNDDGSTYPVKYLD